MSAVQERPVFGNLFLAEFPRDTSKGEVLHARVLAAWPLLSGAIRVADEGVDAGCPFCHEGHELLLAFQGILEHATAEASPGGRKEV